MIISQKKDGPMSSERNITRFLNRKGINRDELVTGKQVHGKEIAVIRKREEVSSLNECDGIMSLSKDLVPGVFVSDCLPISFHLDGICGILHVGWKGLAKGIIEESFRKIERLGRDPKEAYFEIGPGIGACHFEVREDLLSYFKNYNKRGEEEDFVQKRGVKTFFDLKGLARKKMEDRGVRNIKVSSICTFCNKDYFSLRREGEIINMLALIRL